MRQRKQRRPLRRRGAAGLRCGACRGHDPRAEADCPWRLGTRRGAVRDGAADLGPGTAVARTRAMDEPSLQSRRKLRVSTLAIPTKSPTHRRPLSAGCSYAALATIRERILARQRERARRPASASGTRHLLPPPATPHHLGTFESFVRSRAVSAPSTPLSPPQALSSSTPLDPSKRQFPQLVERSLLLLADAAASQPLLTVPESLNSPTSPLPNVKAADPSPAPASPPSKTSISYLLNQPVLD